MSDEYVTGRGYLSPSGNLLEKQRSCCHSQS
jgi:hypothetical protein